MKKLLYLGFCLVLSMGVGCAITDYETITDNTQFVNALFSDKDIAQGKAPEDGFTVDTNGQAHIIETSQIATIWPDGTDELLVFVDQAANGDRALNTYNNFNTADQSTFHDDLFCNPDWAGCAVWAANDSGTLAAAGGGGFGNPQFDGVGDENCLGFRSLSLLAATSRYGGECGNVIFGDTDSDDGAGDGYANPSIADRVAWLNMGVVGEYGGLNGLYFDVNHNNVTINAGGNILPVADGLAFWNPDRRFGMVDLRNPLNQHTVRAFGDAFSPGDVFDLSVTYNGVRLERGVKYIGNAGNLESRW